MALKSEKRYKSIRDEEEKVIDYDIQEFLAAYTAKTVEAEKIESTIDVLRTYMPKANVKYQFSKLIGNEITYVTKAYWICSILVFVCSLFLWFNQRFTAYDTILYATPIPVLLGVLVLGRGKKENMWELEKSFRYSYSMILQARLVMILSFTAIFNITLTLMLYENQGAEYLLRYMATWIAPISILIAVNLFCMMKITTANTLGITFLLWSIALGVWKNQMIAFFQQAESLMIVISMVISISIFLCSIVYFNRKSKIYEGDLAWN